MKESNAVLFGREVIDRTDDVYGLDEEGEIKGSYRPSGYPGVCLPVVLLVDAAMLTLYSSAVVRERCIFYFPHDVQTIG